MEKIPAFIADEMNGDVARWLRIMGFDCIYMTGHDIDKILLKETLNSGRILLTGDRELYRRVIRKGGRAIYTYGNNLEEKFRCISSKINLGKWVGKLPYRCSICNGILERRRSDELKDIPFYIRNRFEYVWYCKKCNKIYWEGSHWKNIRKKIDLLIGIHSKK